MFTPRITRDNHTADGLEAVIYVLQTHLSIQQDFHSLEAVTVKYTSVGLAWKQQESEELAQVGFECLQRQIPQPLLIHSFRFNSSKVTVMVRNKC